MSDEDYIDDCIREDSIETDKEETADEMFEKLGYEKDIGEDFGVVRYKHIKEDFYIRFYIEDRTFDFNKIIKNEIFPLEIDYKLLQAINKKVKELGWLDE